MGMEAEDEGKINAFYGKEVWTRPAVKIFECAGYGAAYRFNVHKIGNTLLVCLSIVNLLLFSYFFTQSSETIRRKRTLFKNNGKISKFVSSLAA